MSNQSTSTTSANLFARKGAAQPVGSGAFEDQARNDNEETPPVSPKPAADATNMAASVFSIDFKKRTTIDQAILAAIGMAAETKASAETQPPAGAAAETAKPAPSAGRPPASLILVMLVAVCIGVGIWYVFHQQRLIEERRVDAASPASPQPAGSDTAGAAESESASITPSFDLIRIEPNGEAVIAGRAPPDSELILLDNGKPIGTVTADWAGEWAFIPDKPLAPGTHKFGLVIMTPQGTVVVPAVGEADKGAALAPADPAAAIARLKAGDYVIQLSSTTTLKGAKQEIAKLQRNFGDLLGGKQLSVYQAKLNPGDVRYRVRSDAFAEKAAARELCAALRAKRQECLVIKR